MWLLQLGKLFLFCKLFVYSNLQLYYVDDLENFLAKRKN